jgi:hypothetical protein
MPNPTYGAGHPTESGPDQRVGDVTLRWRSARDPVAEPVLVRRAVAFPVSPRSTDLLRTENTRGWRTENTCPLTVGWRRKPRDLQEVLSRSN